MVILNKINIDSDLEKGAPVPGFHEESTVILPHLQLDQFNVQNVSTGDFHGALA
jgi:hypothetical protein